MEKADSFLLTPASGRQIQLVKGFWEGEPAVSLFVEGSDEPIVLSKWQTVDLASLLKQLVK